MVGPLQLKLPDAQARQEKLDRYGTKLLGYMLEVNVKEVKAPNYKHGRDPPE